MYMYFTKNQFHGTYDDGKNARAQKVRNKVCASMQLACRHFTETSLSSCVRTHHSSSLF